MQFAKLEGLRNDFIVTHDLSEADIASLKRLAPQLCDRRRGIGADSILAVLPPAAGEADFVMRTINADGSEAEMCGNGIRCVAVYANRVGLTDRATLTVETPAGLIRTWRTGDQVRVDMGAPVLDAARIPTTQPGGRVVMAPLVVDGQTFAVTAVSMGNPHAVIYRDDLTDALVRGYGPKLERHPFFPNRTNVEFINVMSDTEIQMRVWERGCGETAACGTGACASVVAGILNGKHGPRVMVHLTGGDLLVEWDGDPAHAVFMTGPARWVFEGAVDLSAFD
ncbi:MAG: diaminopimelate epimerase [Anaerolineae bacterium]|nr:diaminopimelate epimerase [Anaerolineae bacterium]